MIINLNYLKNFRNKIIVVLGGFFQINNSQLENILEEKILFIIRRKKIKYLRINFIRIVQDLYEKSFNFFLRNFNNILNKLSDIYFLI